MIRIIRQDYRIRHRENSHVGLQHITHQGAVVPVGRVKRSGDWVIV